MTNPHPKSFPNFFWVLVLLLSVGISVYLGRELILLGESQSSVQPHSGPLRISIIDWVGYYPMAAAYKADYLKEERARHGTEVELVKYSNLGEMADAIRTGRTQGSFGVLADFVAMNSLDIPIRMILVTDYSATDYLLSSPHIKNAADLAGKTIGIDHTNPFAEYFVTRALGGHKVSVDKIQFQTVPSPEVPEALARGEIDAGHTWEPHLRRGLQMGFKAIVSSADRPTDIIDCLVLRREVLLRPELTDAIIRAHFWGLRLFREDPDRFAALVAEYYKTSPSEILRIMNGPTHILTLEENFEAFAPNGTLDKEIQSISQFFAGRGMERPEFQAKAILDAGSIRRVGAAQATASQKEDE